MPFLKVWDRFVVFAPLAYTRTPVKLAPSPKIAPPPAAVLNRKAARSCRLFCTARIVGPPPKPSLHFLTALPLWPLPPTTPCSSALETFSTKGHNVGGRLSQLSPDQLGSVQPQHELRRDGYQKTAKQARRGEFIWINVELELQRKSGKPSTPNAAHRRRKQQTPSRAVPVGAPGTVSALRPLPALTVPQSISVADASQLCAAKRTDCVLVVDADDHLAGIFTAKDLAFRVSKWRFLLHMPKADPASFPPRSAGGRRWSGRSLYARLRDHDALADGDARYDLCH